MANLNTNMTLIRAEAELRRRYEAALTYAVQYGGSAWNDVVTLQRQLTLYRRALGMEPVVLEWRPRVPKELAA